MSSLLRPLKVFKQSKHGLLLYTMVLLVGGCAMFASSSGNWDEMFGPAEPRQRLLTVSTDGAEHYRDHVQPILEQRCVVCHGCYDAPCQLKLSSPEGIDRGASKELVYDAARLSEAPLTRLFEDARSTVVWREKGFYPVLNEHEQTPKANLEASVMHHMLALKRDNPLPEGPVLDGKTFDFGLNRKQQCPKPDEIAKFKVDYPLWGMPYGLPGLSDEEFDTLESWLEAGARMSRPPLNSVAIQNEIAGWEAFLNGDSLKQQLMSRYLYEHWFLASLHFSDLGTGEFFKIIRSATPPGQPIKIIATRRPYDDPGVDRVYYRIRRDHSTVLDKTLMPYALDSERMVWLRSLFLDLDYDVETLPSYDVEVAANPFIAFKAVPVESRWQFLLTEAQFTINNFIKGPVCRGQIAVDVIRDNFWVFFDDSKLGYPEEATAFLSEQEGNLRIPSQSATSSAITTWSRYSKSQQAYLQAKTDLLNKFHPDGKGINLDLVWDGDGQNQNAALTVFRHFDSASVVKGLVGPEPKTAWLVDYPVLERIHYLLVAGFDVYGKAGHQLTTRLYMDFLRLEGEFNFLALLPKETRQKERKEWYKGASKKQQSYIYGAKADFEQPTNIKFKTDNPKLELYGMLKQRMAPVLNKRFELEQPGVPVSHLEALQRLQTLRGLNVSLLPEMVVLNVQSADGRDHYYTVLHNRAHSNVTSLFRESDALIPEEDTLAVVKGFIGSYPNAYWRVPEAQLSALVDDIARLDGEAAYAQLMDNYGVRRTSPEFWAHSDQVMEAHKEAGPLTYGLFDYNRLENR